MTRAAALAALTLALVLAVGPAAAQTAPLRNDQGKQIPRLSAPEPHEIPDFDRLGTRVLAGVDAARLRESLSRPLSAACSIDRFNQARRGRYFLDLRMPDGEVKRFGFAGSNGLNLRDPKGLAAQNQGYLFELDGTSECKVYVTPVTW
ncbi:MAG: hypothetical protein RIB45_08975 [Marivibrio sp.]|uniref:hypothetical protein n=1 Tax=Marivibrio sp. TaxID=2039719 RepID=UPI0032EBA60E